jgi:MFS family permease
MPPIGFAGIWRGRMHYAWIVLAVMFSATLAGVGVRAAPGVMIVPLQRAFGWDVATVSGAVSLNIILLGATGPFLTGLIEVIGLKRTILACMTMLIAGTGLSNLMTAPWQLFLTWGLMVGIGSGAGAIGMAAAVANRWFVKRNGVAMGLLTAANAAGQLIFLPLLAMLAQRYGWRGVSVAVTLAVLAMVPVVAILLPEWPANIGLDPYGAATSPSPTRHQSNPFAVAVTALATWLASANVPWGGSAASQSLSMTLVLSMPARAALARKPAPIAADGSTLTTPRHRKANGNDVRPAPPPASTIKSSGSAYSAITARFGSSGRRGSAVISGWSGGRPSNKSPGGALPRNRVRCASTASTRAVYRDAASPAIAPSSAPSATNDSRNIPATQTRGGP